MSRTLKRAGAEHDATIHSHSNYDPDNIDEEFSHRDLVNLGNVDQYVATPGGRLYVHRMEGNEDGKQIICACLDYDPKSPYKITTGEDTGPHFENFKDLDDNPLNGRNTDTNIRGTIFLYMPPDTRKPKNQNNKPANSKISPKSATCIGCYDDPPPWLNPNKTL